MTHTANVHSTKDVAGTKTDLITWLQRIGYKPESPTFLSEIKLTRGTSGSSMYAICGNGWGSRISAKVVPAQDGCDVELVWTMSTLGQIGTKSDMQFWRTEIALTLAAACGTIPDRKIYGKAISRNQLGNARRIALLLALLIAAIVVISSGSNLTVVILAAAAALAIAVAFYFVFRVSRDLGTVGVSIG